MKATTIDGAVLSPEAINTICLFQNGGLPVFVDSLEKMIDFLLEDDIPAELDDPKMRIMRIQNLRYLEKLILTFKKPNENGNKQ